VSELVKSSLIDEYHVDDNDISVIRFPVDTTYWSRRCDDRKDALRILFVGADLYRKGGDLVLAAARRREFAGCEFHIVTRSEVMDAPANVFVHHDVTPGSEQLRELFSSASIFVLPTLADLSPIVLAEAMAMELPVVTTEVGAISEQVEDGQNGYVVSPGDADAFRERLRALTDSSDLRESMGRRGRSKVEAEHSLATNVERYLDVLEEAARSTHENASSRSTTGPTV
jgi:glycosyltransferase involved in cell wall biosynthesis